MSATTSMRPGFGSSSTSRLGSSRRMAPQRTNDMNLRVLLRGRVRNQGKEKTHCRSLSPDELELLSFSVQLPLLRVPPPPKKKQQQRKQTTSVLVLYSSVRRCIRDSDTRCCGDVACGMWRLSASPYPLDKLRTVKLLRRATRCQLQPVLSDSRISASFGNIKLPCNEIHTAPGNDDAANGSVLPTVQLCV